MTAEIEKNLASMDLDKYDDEDGKLTIDCDIVGDLIFTTEFEKLKPGKQKKDDEDMIDEEVQSGSDEDVSSFEDPADGEKRRKFNDDDYPSELEDSEDEKEDYTIRKSDSLIVAATAENDHSNLEVYVYDHKTSDMYVHHEIILSSYPLCMEWMHSYRGEKTNMIIVGTFLPEIEIWDINKEDCEPVAVLGHLPGEDLKQKKKKVIKSFNNEKTLSAPPQHDESSHTDAVMSLSLNPFQLEYLASGSADCTVRIWDLEELTCKATFTNLHKNKVQLVRWNPN